MIMMMNGWDDKKLMKRFNDKVCFEKNNWDLRWSINAISKASEEHEQGDNDNDNVKEKNRWTKFDQSEYSILSPDASGYDPHNVAKNIVCYHVAHCRDEHSVLSSGRKP